MKTSLTLSAIAFVCNGGVINVAAHLRNRHQPENLIAAEQLEDDFAPFRGLSQVSVCANEPIVDLRNETVLIELTGRPNNVAQLELDILERSFRHAYNGAVSGLCTGDSFKSVKAVTVSADLGTETESTESMGQNSRPFLARFFVESQCRGCDVYGGLFANTTLAQGTGTSSSCPFCISPTPQSFLQHFRADILTLVANSTLASIDNATKLTEFERVPCNGDDSIFDTMVVVDFIGDPNVATPAELAALERGFQQTYNNLNAYDPTTCDPLFRQITQVQVVDTTARFNRGRRRRSLEETTSQAGGLFIHPGFFQQACLGCTRIQRDFAYRIRVRGTCRGCRRDANLYDEGTDLSPTSARNLLQGRFLQTSTTTGVPLVPVPDDCVCPVGANEFRAPSRTEFQFALDNTVQQLANDGELSFINATEEVVEVDPVPCETDINQFTTIVSVDSFGILSDVNRLDQHDLTEAFIATYNDLAEGTCDPLFRSVHTARLEEIQDSMPNSTVARAFTLRFRVYGRCRGCLQGTNLFDFFAQRALQTRSAVGRRLEDDGLCFCDVNGLLNRRPPTINEFEAAFAPVVTGLVQTIESVADVNETSINPPDERQWEPLGNNVAGLSQDSNFGTSVCMSEDGQTLAAGGLNANVGDAVNAGEFRVLRYHVQSRSWIQLGDTLEGAESERIGAACSISADGETVAFVSTARRFAKLFTYDSSVNRWNQLGDTLNEVSGAHSISLARDGRTVAVGSRVVNNVRILNYEESEGMWVQIGQEISGEAAGDFSGEAVALSGDGLTVAIGAPRNDGTGREAGHVRVYIYSISLARWNQFPQDVDLDGESAGDAFGSVVAISGNGRTFAVGAPLYDRVVDGSTTLSVGRVVVYEYSTSAANWIQLGQAFEGEALGDRVGESLTLSVDGRTIAMGWLADDQDGLVNNGSVRVFVYIESMLTWIQRGSRIAGQASLSQSGAAVALAGDGRTIAIGAPSQDVDGVDDSGNVQTYKWTYDLAPPPSSVVTPRPTLPPSTMMPTAPGWEQVGLDIDAISEGDNFGAAVCMSKDGLTIAGGGPLHDGIDSDSGYLRALIFDPQTQTWNRLGQDIEGQSRNTRLGGSCSMSLDGRTVAVWSTTMRRVEVLRYNDRSGRWSQLGQHFDNVAGSTPVAISSDGLTVVVGELSSTSRVFAFNSTAWEQVGQVINGEAVSDRAGWAVAISGDGQTIAIGAPHNDARGLQSGHVRVYTYSDSLMRWTQLAQDMDINGGAAGDTFGHSLSMSVDGRTIAVGAPFHDSTTDPMQAFDWGKTVVYSFSEQLGSWRQIGQTLQGPAAGVRFGHAVALSSDGRTLAASSVFYDTAEATNAGSVRVMVYLEGTDTWVQRGEDITGEAALDGSGAAVAISGDGLRVAIGAPSNDNDGRPDAGQIRVFQWNYALVPPPSPIITRRPTAPPTTQAPTSETWVQLGDDLDAQGEGDLLGTSVCMAQNRLTVAVGAPNGELSSPNSGYVRVLAYQTQTSTWEQVGQTIEGQEGERIGSACSMSSDGTTLAVFSSSRRLVRVYGLGQVGLWWELWGQLGSTIDSVSGASPVALSEDGLTMVTGGDGFSRTRVFAYNSTEWEQVGQEISGETTGERAGSAVAISGDGQTIAIGAPNNDGAGLNAGHVRVYYYSTALSRWTQLAQDMDIDGGIDGDAFGSSLAMSKDGRTIAVGAPFHDSIVDPLAGQNLGKVLVYHFSEATFEWLQLGQTIEGSNQGDRLGESVALSSDGRTLAVASYLFDNILGTNVGLVRVLVYVPQTLTWVHRGLDLVGEGQQDESGSAVAMSGDGLTIAIGAPKNDNDGRRDAGHARVYQWNHDLVPAPSPSNTPRPTAPPTDLMPIGQDWVRLGMDVDAEAQGDGFGTSVCMSEDGSTIGVGAPLHGTANAGYIRVLVYNAQNQSWMQLGQDMQGQASDRFGSGCAMASDGLTLAGQSNARLYVQVYSYNSQTLMWEASGNRIESVSGVSPVSLSADGLTIACGNMGFNRVQVFALISLTNTWIQLGENVPRGSSQRFGTSVSLSASGTILAVGAQASGSNAGAALVFEYSSAAGTWTQLGDMLSGEADGDHFGISVALSGDGSTVAVGGYFHDGGDQGSLPNAGHVRVFSFSNQQWIQLGQDIDGVAEQDRAGERVAISHNGRTVAVAAVLHDGVDGPNSGHVRILDYNNDAAVRSQRGSDIDGEGRLDQSGSGIAISGDGNTVAIGAPNNDNDGRYDAGHVRVYNWPL